MRKSKCCSRHSSLSLLAVVLYICGHSTVLMFLTPITVPHTLPGGIRAAATVLVLAFVSIIIITYYYYCCKYFVLRIIS